MKRHCYPAGQCICGPLARLAVLCFGESLTPMLGKGRAYAKTPATKATDGGEDAPRGWIINGRRDWTPTSEDYFGGGGGGVVRPAICRSQDPTQRRYYTLPNTNF